MKLTYLAVAATGGLAAIATLPASAQIYASVGYTSMKVDLGPGARSTDVTIGAITGRVGVGVAPFISVEGEVSKGVKDDTFRWIGAFQTETSNFSLNNQIGAYVVGRVPIPAVGAVFARAGYVNTDFSTGGMFPADDGGGAAYGAGVELDVIPFIRGRLEYTKYDGMHAEGISASAAMKF
ncbi:MAG TPA: outer membrane beta-barrel protein [Hyphomonadaceae bacterium]|nr:outer membrane beta-barrel protein [Hyphomonadaceae bacterium]